MAYDDALAGRCSLPNHIYHITVCTYYRQPVFSSWQVGRVLVHELRHMQEHYNIQSLAWVLMPDHLHWLLQLNESASLTNALSIFKGRSARNINQHLGRKGKLWQKGFYEQAIRQNDDIRHVARYIVANPLRARLVQTIGDYPLWDAIWL